MFSAYFQLVISNKSRLGLIIYQQQNSYKLWKPLEPRGGGGGGYLS